MHNFTRDGPLESPFYQAGGRKEGVNAQIYHADSMKPARNAAFAAIKFGKMGRFSLRAGHQCSYTRNIDIEEAAERIAENRAEQAELDGRECPKWRSPGVATGSGHRLC